MPPQTHRSLRATRLAQSQSQRRLWIVATAVASSGSALPTFTAQQVGQHRSEDDCWLVIDGFVYDITAFLRSHPGGIAIILPYAGRDATRIFHALHDADFLKEFGRRYIVGVLHGVGQPAVSRGTGLKGGGVTPRAGKLYLAEDPRGMEWPNDFPKAFRWLAARYVPPSLPLPLSLRPLSAAGGRSGATGLHVMSPAHWIEVDGDCFASEMAKKRKLLLTERSNAGENPWYNNVFQAETDTAAEQEELLEVLIDNLVTYHPDKYSLRGREIIVEETGDAYCIDDWIAPHTDSAGRPIAIQLASLLVQEEFYILRRKGKLDAAAAGQEEEGVRSSPTGGLPGPAVEVPYRYEFCAGTSCLNFLRNGINGERGNMAPRNAMHTIHAPVPGMAEHGWHRKLGHIFSTLTDETALYRTNFGIDQDNRNTYTFCAQYLWHSYTHIVHTTSTYKHSICAVRSRYYLDDHNEFQSAEAVLAEYVIHRRRRFKHTMRLERFGQNSP